MNEAMWKSFLAEYNRELLSYEEVIEGLPREIIKADWLGFPGATEEEIAIAEKRLATNLPPSYRAFLKTSNGWRFPSVFIPSLFQAEKVAWFREKNQDWIDAYADPAGEVPPISDKEYLVYGDKQDCAKFRWEYFQGALQVSEAWDGAVVLLNPKTVTPEGEWETWLFANFNPGATRYRSFGDWLRAERAFCQNQLKVLPKSEVKKFVTAKKPRSVRKAGEAARSGQTDVALESLEAFLAKGEETAALPLAELYAFLGQWDKVIVNAEKSLVKEGYSTANDFQELVKLLGLAGRRTGEWDTVAKAGQAALQANASRNYDQYHQHIPEYNGQVFRNLIAYAQRQGAPPHDLFVRDVSKLSEMERLALEAAKASLVNKEATMSLEERQAWYQNAVKKAEANPFLKTDQNAKMEHLFSLAKGVLEDEALKIFEAHGANFPQVWKATEFVAGVHLRRGNPEAAWALMERNLGRWWPAPGLGLVAPMVLLMDERFSPMMTPERCRLVLATPRGPEALKKGQ